MTSLTQYEPVVLTTTPASRSYKWHLYKTFSTNSLCVFLSSGLHSQPILTLFLTTLPTAPVLGRRWRLWHITRFCINLRTLWPGKTSAWWLALSEVPCSNLGSGTDYTDQRFSWFFSVSSNKAWNYLKTFHDRFLPHLFPAVFIATFWNQ
jgi:hypothetical protein